MSLYAGKIGKKDSIDIGLGGLRDFSFSYENSKGVKKSTILSIISNKGGVGKTSLSLIFSMFFSSIINKKTLLLELDSSPGDFASLFDIDAGNSLELALKFPEKYKKYTKNISKNLDALKGISNPLVAEGIKKELIYKLLNYIQQEYEYVIVDTQTVLNGVVLDTLRISDSIFVVSDFSLESISRISSLIDLLVEKFSISKSRIKVIINKKKLWDFLKIGDLCKIAKFPVEAFITMDRKFDKTMFLLNRRKIFKTKFFKEVRRMLEEYSNTLGSYTLEKEVSDGVKR